MPPLYKGRVYAAWRKGQNPSTERHEIRESGKKKTSADKSHPGRQPLVSSGEEAGWVPQSVRA